MASKGGPGAFLIFPGVSETLGLVSMLSSLSNLPFASLRAIPHPTPSHSMEDCWGTGAGTGRGRGVLGQLQTDLPARRDCIWASDLSLAPVPRSSRLVSGSFQSFQQMGFTSPASLGQPFLPWRRFILSGSQRKNDKHESRLYLKCGSFGQCEVFLC